jgi:hypothetical protein
MRSLHLSVRTSFLLLSALLVSGKDAVSEDRNDVNKNRNDIMVKKLDKLRDMSLCEHLRPDELPKECSCREPGPFDVVVECTKTFNSSYFNDTIGISINLLPCDPNGSKVSLDVTEKTHGIDFPITGLRAGEAKNIPIPGLSIAVPGVGHLGVDAAVLITGVSSSSCV